MKAKTLFFVFMAFVVISANAQERGPDTISPGSEEGVAFVSQSCPTFSWTSVEWAVAYKLVVFEKSGSKVLAYKEMEAIASPILIKDIKGRALSWTPSSDDRLSNGGMYVWYVQAFDVYGQGTWSEGRIFKVDVGLRIDGLEENVRKKLHEQGVREEAIEEVLEDMRSGVRDVIAYGLDPRGLDEKVRIQDIEGEGANNTLFGLGAGENLTSGIGNTFIGHTAGASNTEGNKNSFHGQGAGYSNTIGAENTFMGMESGYNNNGSWNTFLGYHAGYLNSTGENNTFIGHTAGASNTVGDWNTFLGYEAGLFNTTGYRNVFLGYWAGYKNTEGENNTFVGAGAGYANTTGYSNTFLGGDAGDLNTTGNNNTYIGTGSGLLNTTGNFNTFLGSSTGGNNTEGYENTFLGFGAGYANTTGRNNVFIGQRTGETNTEGFENTYIGDYAGYNATGSGNVFLGLEAGRNETGSNRLYIDNSSTISPLIWGNFSSNILTVHGKLGVGTTSPAYQMEIETSGENAILLIDRTDGATTGFSASGDKCAFGTLTNHPLWMVINGAFSAIFHTDGSLQMMNGAWCTAAGKWQDASSRKLKENIQSLTVVEAKQALEGLDPVRFNYKADADDESLGFIAEDVPELVASKDRKSMSAMDVVAVLTKVVQEQQETIGILRKEIDELKKENK